ncbi:hypothetical protein RSOLAG1IB_10712 [Rhizoctonia solani AG-1 IB]|uniref:Uncharacterized protein n=1 Tax=Thanatephorus cucumeris (strain AG1-IB / isolate 7/3/14) TaxID=1108050 RepID=A0A0B7FZI6_THACB|nr:hypothetical protein RSOLAG1IB_10712 [Rhizoctonia solani AG-1 IB]
MSCLDDAFACPLRETLSKFYLVAPEFKQGRLQLYNTMILVGGSTSTLYSPMGKIQGEARYLQYAYMLLNSVHQEDCQKGHVQPNHYIAE